MGVRYNAQIRHEQKRQLGQTAYYEPTMNASAAQKHSETVTGFFAGSSAREKEQGQTGGMKQVSRTRDSVWSS